jgi:hypothetical protein
MKKIHLLIAFLIFSLLTSLSFAEELDFTGSYEMQGPEGVISLTLKQSSDGAVTGTMSGNGVTMQVEGIISDGFLVGALYDESGGVFIESGFEGDQLYFMLIEPDENNMPDYTKTSELVFNRKSAAAPEKEESKVPPSLRDKIAGKSGDKSETPAEDKETAASDSKIAASNEIGSDEIGNKSWGFKFKKPGDWKFEQNDQMVLLGHDTIAGLIIVIPHEDGPFDKMKSLFASGYQEESFMLNIKGEIKKIDDLSVSANVNGTADGTDVDGYAIGTVSPIGNNGAYIICLTTPEMFKPELSSVVDQIHKSMSFFKVEVSEMLRTLAGKWTTTTTNTQTIYYLYPNGKFIEDYEASYSDDGTGDLNWSQYAKEDNSGTWTAKGSRENGVITLKFGNGNVSEIQYKVHVENGKTYYDEYWFNGNLYGRTAID